MSSDPRGGAMLGIAFGTAFFVIEPVACIGEIGSRTKRTLFWPFAALVVAEEKADREFVESMRRTVVRIP